jgi:antitoxin component YwqK of YwqJK toxin-antitoxin module
MKQILYLSSFFFLLSCESPIIEKVEETYPNNQAKQITFYQEQDGKEVKISEKYFYQDGQVKMEGEILNNKREGVWKAYFKNGQLQSEGVFKENKRIGVGKVYFRNGKLRYEGQYENDEEVGHWKFYNDKGQLVKEKDFKNE